MAISIPFSCQVKIQYAKRVFSLSVNKEGHIPSSGAANSFQNVFSLRDLFEDK